MAVRDPSGNLALAAACLVNAGAPFVVGAVVANLILIDGSLQGATVIGYAISACAGAAVGLVSIRPTRRLLGRLGRSLGFGFRDVLAGAAGMLGLLLGALDAMVWPDRYWNAHTFLLLGSAVSFSAMTVALSSRARIARALYFLCVLLGLSSLPGFLSLGVAQAASRATSSFTLHRRLILLARSLSDADDDGFSPALGGGDCDDSDPRTYPLSLVGKDCLSWSNAATTEDIQEPSALDGSMSARAELAPRFVLLVTIDAFRCGMGERGAAPLRDACPQISSLGREGKSRHDAHTTYPATRRAFGSLHSGIPCFEENSTPRFLLASWMAEQGYQTRVVSTHENQLPGALRSSFQSVDESLLVRASQPTAATAEEVTDRGLAAIADAQRDANHRLFLWLHYFDTHAPYAGTSAGSLVTEPELRRYAREVQRVDSAIGRLTSSLRQNGSYRQTLMLLTADHGEEFGELGHYRHGGSINENAVKIPMIAWSPDAAVMDRLPQSLPANNAEVPAYLVAGLSGRPFVSSNETFFWVRSDETVAFGIYSAGKKLTYSAADNRIALFNLVNDPDERENLSRKRPELVAELAPRLVSHLRRCRSASSFP